MKLRELYMFVGCELQPRYDIEPLVLSEWILGHLRSCDVCLKGGLPL